MEMITAIALLCQLNIGIGVGYKLYNFRDAKDMLVREIEDKQQTCQKRLARCILEKDKDEVSFKQSTFLKCIKER